MWHDDQHAFLTQFHLEPRADSFDENRLFYEENAVLTSAASQQVLRPLKDERPA